MDLPIFFQCLVFTPDGAGSNDKDFTPQPKLAIVPGRVQWNGKDLPLYMKTLACRWTRHPISIEDGHRDDLDGAFEPTPPADSVPPAPQSSPLYVDGYLVIFLPAVSPKTLHFYRIWHLPLYLILL